jgi:hypothetical protein
VTSGSVVVGGFCGLLEYLYLSIFRQHTYMNILIIERYRYSNSQSMCLGGH